MDPLVTVGLPIYNAEAYLAECIESIKAQTLREFTVLAVLDGPTDNSEAILRKNADSRFQIIKNPGNLGIKITCNNMLELCPTELFARMDSDDIMWPQRLEIQVKFMQAHPEITVCGGQFDIIDVNGKRIQEPYPFATDPAAVREQFRISPAVHHPASIYRVEPLKKLGGFSTDFAEDNVLWLKAMAHGLQFANVPETVLSYRVHNTQMMSRRREQILSSIDQAYADYGPAIWGDRAPDFVSGATRVERLKRRIKRKLSHLFTK